MKKTNAALGLAALLLLLIHVVVQAYIYLTFSYLPLLSKVTAYGFLAAAAAHALLSVGLLLFAPGGLRRDLYPGLNRRTTLQRVSALGILLLLPLHINNFRLMQGSAGKTPAIAALVLAELVFFALTLLHVGTSLSRGFLSLGWLDSLEKQRRTDRIVWIALGLLMLAAAVGIIRTQLAMFGG